MDSKYHRWLLDAYDRRLQGDYGFDATFASEDIVEMISQASEFLEAARGLAGSE